MGDREQTTTFEAREGGVATHEVGTVTGRLEIATTDGPDGPTHRVRYEGADEWYTPQVAPGLGHDEAVQELATPAATPDPADAADPAPGSGQGRDADDPAAGTFGGARRG